jgi:ribonucleoside-diphosphate reductase alpha chain
MNFNKTIAPRFFLKNENLKTASYRVASELDNRGFKSIYFEMLSKGQFVPAGQIWRGAGFKDAILYNCFVTSAHKEEEAIDVATRISNWTRRGCGVGINVSEWVRTASNFSCQKDALFHIIHLIAINQDKLWHEGIFRTATMINIDFDIDGIEDIANLISGNPVYRHLNLGILITDEIMESYNRELKSNDITNLGNKFSKLILQAWSSGNPGFIFIDKVNELNKYDEKIIACNPCAEQYLHTNEGCNLGSLNLTSFIKNGIFQWEEFKEITKLAVNFLDSVVDYSSFPCQDADKLAKERRRIGLGIMGFSSALDRLNIPYDSSKALELAELIGDTLWDSANKQSILLAHRKAYNLSSNIFNSSNRRNSHLLSIAPTGAISMLWNVSSGIEPIFYNRYKKGSYLVNHQLNNLDTHTKTSTEIDWKFHVDMLSVWQKYIDGGISKTINLPNFSTKNDVKLALFRAWRSGCKGVAFFRDGCRTSAINRN